MVRSPSLRSLPEMPGHDLLGVSCRRAIGTGSCFDSEINAARRTASWCEKLGKLEGIKVMDIKYKESI